MIFLAFIYVTLGQVAYLIVVALVKEKASCMRCFVVYLSRYTKD